MPNDSFHDIVPPERRSIRDINNARTSGKHHGQSKEERMSDTMGAEMPIEKKRFTSFLWYAVGGLIIALVALFAVFSFFSGATLTVYPKNKEVLVNGQFEALRESEAGFSYNVMTLTKTVSESVEATGEIEAEDRASGTIVIFNDFDENPQRLIKNTRFETPDGLIYRIDESIVVPGQRSEGGETLPGSIEVVVYADEAGERYNIGLTDFTVPGFEGTPRFESFYARSKTPMMGGFVGTRLAVDEKTQALAEARLEEKARGELLLDAFAQKPDGFYLFENAIFLIFEPMPVTEDSNRAMINLKATLHGVLFNEAELARFVAEQTLAGYEGEPVEIIDASSLTFRVLDREKSRPWIDEGMEFSLSGTTRIAYTFDQEQLKNDLLGRDKDSLPTILSGYPAINEAVAVIRPFWKGSFPSTSRDINIERVIENAP